jgi:hypothetical protein
MKRTANGGVTISIMMVELALSNAAYPAEAAVIEKQRASAARELLS